jgi:transcriptional regulator with XRE-family HTH domain
MNEALRLLRVFNGKKTPSLEVIQKYATFFETTPSTIMLLSEGLEKNQTNLRAKLSKAIVGFLQNIEEHSED